eukprot:Pompholyxophrys_sp_v1_NODE_89_length_2120_cov_1.527361.p2 type:complete len:103 gc:universal NODE_89_length_2120_cov_1.527361:550-242(-)
MGEIWFSDWKSKIFTTSHILKHSPQMSVNFFSNAANPDKSSAGIESTKPALAKPSQNRRREILAILEEYQLLHVSSLLCLLNMEHMSVTCSFLILPNSNTLA